MCVYENRFEMHHMCVVIWRKQVAPHSHTHSERSDCIKATTTTHNEIDAKIYFKSFLSVLRLFSFAKTSQAENRFALQESTAAAATDDGNRLVQQSDVCLCILLPIKFYALSYDLTIENNAYKCAMCMSVCILKYM